MNQFIQLQPKQKSSSMWRPFRFAPLLMFSLTITIMLQGCNVVTIVGYLIGGPPSVEPDFDKETTLSMTDKDVKVAIICVAPTSIKWDFDEIDRDLANAVAARLVSHQIKLVDPNKVQVWLDKHPEWDKPQELGKDLDATYVIYIDLSKFSLYENDSHMLYRGRAEAMVSVYEMDEDGDGEKIYSKNITSEFPHAIPRATQDISFTKFKKEYRAHLSDVIGRLFYEYYNGDDFDAAT